MPVEPATTEMTFPAPGVSGAARADTLAGHLGGMLTELSDLGGREEKQFMFIGVRLADFRSRSKKISAQSAEAVDLLAGKEGRATLQGLHALLAELDTHLLHVDDQSRDNDDLLLALGVQLEQMEIPLQALAKVVKALLALSFATRVEGTQGESGPILRVLADNLKELGAKVTDKTDQVREMIETMARLGLEAREKLQTLQDQGLSRARTVIAEGRIAIDRLQEHQQRCHEGTARLSSHFARSHQAIDEIIVSIQFHDITRQQLDHVRSALYELARELERLGRSTGPGVAETLARIVPNVCRIQTAQLQHTRSELTTAVEQMITSLRELDDNISELAAETRELAGAAAADGNSFYGGLEPVASAVAELLNDSTVTNRQAVAAVAAVLGAMDQLRALLGEIELIGTEMRMISFNAGITAAHNMERGAGLGVIAASIQSLSEQVRGRTLEFSRGYHAIETVVGALTQRGGHLEQAETVVRAELKRMASEQVSGLRDADSRLLASLRLIDEGATGLAHDIRATAESISVHVDVAQVLEETIAGLETMIEDCQVEGVKAVAVDGEMVERLSDLYTMQSEREVHRHLAGSPSRDRRAPLPEQAPVKGNEFGANVELF